MQFFPISGPTEFTGTNLDVTLSYFSAQSIYLISRIQKYIGRIWSPWPGSGYFQLERNDHTLETCLLLARVNEHLGAPVKTSGWEWGFKIQTWVNLVANLFYHDVTH